MDSGQRGITIAVVATMLALSLYVPAASAVSDERPQATVYTIDVDENGDATWTIELRYQLVDDEEVDAFESLRDDFRQGELEVFEGIEEDMEPFADEASVATDRPMTLSEFERDVYIRESLTQTVGVVTVSFEWSGFAAVEDSEVRIGDVFVGSGLALTSNERLVVETFDEPPLRSVSPEPDTNDGDRLVWDGERFFEEGQPSVVFAEDEPGAGNGDENGTDDGGSDTPGGMSTAATLAAGALVLLTGFAGGLYLGRKAGIVGKREEEEEKEKRDGADAEEETVETELLTDEDRVIRILEKKAAK